MKADIQPSYAMVRNLPFADWRLLDANCANLTFVRVGHLGAFGDIFPSISLQQAWMTGTGKPHCGTPPKSNSRLRPTAPLAN
ncbi:MAG: hypothetical protein WCC66_05655, partial [Rhizobiaceae bacterium]